MAVPPLRSAHELTATNLPRGTVTFLFTIIDGSIALWERIVKRWRPW